MAKAKRGLLLSVLTLLIAIAVTATSTYAWFAANSSVTATNMNLTLRSDTSFLVIKAAAVSDAAPSYSNIGEATSVTATAPNSVTVLPARYNSTATPESGYTKWEYAAGLNYSDGTATGGYHAIAESGLGGYVVHYVFYVALAATTQTAASNLKITTMSVTSSTTGQGFKGAVSALITIKDASSQAAPTEFNITNIDTHVFTVAGVNDAQTSSDVILATVALNTIYQLDAYVYVNGDNTSVTSANATAANLGGYAVSMSLAVD